MTVESKHTIALVQTKYVFGFGFGTHYHHTNVFRLFSFLRTVQIILFRFLVSGNVKGVCLSMFWALFHGCSSTGVPVVSSSLAADRDKEHALVLAWDKRIQAAENVIRKRLYVTFDAWHFNRPILERYITPKSFKASNLFQKVSIWSRIKHQPYSRNEKKTLDFITLNIVKNAVYSYTGDIHCSPRMRSKSCMPDAADFGRFSATYLDLAGFAKKVDAFHPYNQLSSLFIQTALLFLKTDGLFKFAANCVPSPQFWPYPGDFIKVRCARSLVVVPSARLHAGQLWWTVLCRAVQWQELVVISFDFQVDQESIPKLLHPLWFPRGFPFTWTRIRAVLLEVRHAC